MTFNFVQNLIAEIDAMVRYASGVGKTMPSDIVLHLYKVQQKLEQQKSLPAEERIEHVLTEDEVVSLSKHHAVLTALVSPAQPKSIALMKRESDSPGLFYFLGPVSLVRRLSLLAIFFLAMIIVVSVSPQVNHRTISQGLFESEGVTLLLNQLFLLGCAGLGATFACLNQLSGFIKQGIYDPKFDSTYWIRVIMGLMGGLIISELIPVDTLNALEGDSPGAIPVGDFDKPMAALLGGFSADVIYRILNRFVVLIGQFIGAQNTDRQELDMLRHQVHQMKTQQLEAGSDALLNLSPGLDDVAQSSKKPDPAETLGVRENKPADK